MMVEQVQRKRVLIVGGSGFLSGTLAKRALDEGHRVWTITRGQKQLPDGVKALIADRNDVDTFSRVVEQAASTWDLVVDCIAFKPEDIQQDVEVFGSYGKHLIFVSTDFVYDPKKRRFPQGEEDAQFVTEGYGYGKRMCELALLRYQGDLPWTVVRPPHIYGPGSALGCLPNHSRDPGLVAKIKAGEKLELVGGGYFLQQPVLARDLADLFLDMMGVPEAFGQIFNAPGPEVIESRRYYQIVAEILGVKARIEEIAVAPYLTKNANAASFLCHRFYDRSKLEATGVPLPGTSMRVGLEEQVLSLTSG